MDELAGSDTVDILRHPAWSRLRRGWRQPRQQHDVSELLHFLSLRLGGAALAGEWAIHRPTIAEPGRLIDNSSTHPYITMNLGSSHTVQELIHHWRGAQSQPLTALVIAPELLLICLARFQYRRGQPRKLRQKIDVHRHVFLPIFQPNRRRPAPVGVPEAAAGSAARRKPASALLHH